MKMVTTSLLAKLSRIAAGLVLTAAFATTSSGASAETILFIGNSFTYGALSDVQSFRPSTVTDLNGTNIGGVPALFKAFTSQAGLNYTVSLETQPGSGLDFHYDNRLALINKPWDNVVMHGQSTLDFADPGNPAKLIEYSALLADLFKLQNPNVEVQLTSTWSRADQTYQVGGAWYGQSIYQMALDVHAGYLLADGNSSNINGVIPVGLAWNRAMSYGVADTYPYDGIDAGKLNLWATDSYHASNFGYYLEALVIFGQITDLDPRSLGLDEIAGKELGFTQDEVRILQQIAFDQLAALQVPEPPVYGLIAIAVVAMLWSRRRRRGD